MLTPPHPLHRLLLLITARAELMAMSPPELDDTLNVLENRAFSLIKQGTDVSRMIDMVLIRQQQKQPPPLPSQSGQPQAQLPSFIRKAADVVSTGQVKAGDDVAGDAHR